MRVVRTALLVSTCTLLGIPPAAGQAPAGSYLGVMVQEIDTQRAKALKLPEEAGVEITRIESDSPAEKAGLKTGDVVQQYNGQRVEGFEQFSRLVRETPGGRDVKLNIIRDGSPQTLSAKVGTRHAPLVFNTPVAPPLTQRFDLHLPDIPRSFLSWRSSALGCEAESLEGQLAQYFGVKEGVLVRSVVKGGAAEKAGIKAGDVITRVGDGKVTTPADISGRVRPVHGNSIPVVLMRDHKEMTLTVTLSEDDRAERRGWQPHLGPMWLRTIGSTDSLL